ncbi:MAG: Nif3-like dinuclear metal center hexameric protein [Opitutaceae bacterium]
MPLRFPLIATAFVLALAPRTFSATPPNPTPALTAAQVIERIQQQTAIPWTGPTVDVFKAGDPNTPVKGIAVTMMATFDVLRRAAASGANLIITHEPTFYGHQDVTAGMETENDQVLAAKQELIKKHGLVIFRFHDYLHRMKPDPVITGVTNVLGWQKFQTNPAEGKYVLPETTLEELAAHIRDRFRIKALRVVGDPKSKVTKIGFSPGASGFAAHRRVLQGPDVEVLMFGEGTEWDTIEYGVDAVAAGQRKGLIILGHIPSEEAGMIECTKWLKTFVTEVPVEFVVTPEPFWSPK